MSMESSFPLSLFSSIKNNKEKENNIVASKHQQQKFKDRKKYFVICDSCSWFATLISHSDDLSEGIHNNKKCLYCKKDLSWMFTIKLNNL